MFKIPMWRPTEVQAETTPAKTTPDARAALCGDGTDAEACENAPLPEVIAQSNPSEKSPAEWAYERIILYIQNFEKNLDDDHEVGLGFVSGGAGVMRITGMGYFAPDMVTFYGRDDGGAKTQLVQHVSQLNVMLKAAPKLNETPTRIGFDLSRGLDGVSE